MVGEIFVFLYYGVEIFQRFFGLKYVLNWKQIKVKTIIMKRDSVIGFITQQPSGNNKHLRKSLITQNNEWILKLPP